MSGKRASLSLMKKCEIIKEVDQQKTLKAEIARQHGILKSTLFTVLKMIEEIVNAVQKEGRNTLPASRRVQCRPAGGMFCKLMPDRTLAVKGDVCKGMKKSKECLTVIVCCNMDGSNKMKPLEHRAGVPSKEHHQHASASGLRDNSAGEAEVPGNACAEYGSENGNIEGYEEQKTIANCFSHTHFVTPVDEEAAVHVFLAAASSEDPDDPPPVDAEPQPGPSTVPLSARLTVTRLCDEETWQQFAPDCTFEEFVTVDDIAVDVTVDDYADDVRGQQESSGEVEEPAQVLTTRDILKAGDSYAAVLRQHGANEEMWSHFTHLRVFVEQTLVKKKQTTIKDFFKK
ncbi:hypothetical protein PR048_004803 [Dryococelus australis]|uniref:HTH psq-type domain-containing protein n=1 Tax=Dryococelus australis TaxID=614101 RepID=A0ABQ9I8F9_9NEOP|nr:hypothetical protein PR048_004803 [Dryococelus australis]